MTDYHTIIDTLIDVFTRRYNVLLESEFATQGSLNSRECRMKSLEVLNTINYLKDQKPKLKLQPDQDGYIEDLDMFLPKDEPELYCPVLNDLKEKLGLRSEQLNDQIKVNLKRKHEIFDQTTKLGESYRLRRIVQNIEDIIIDLENSVAESFNEVDLSFTPLNINQLYKNITQKYE